MSRYDLWVAVGLINSAAYVASGMESEIAKLSLGIAWALFAIVVAYAERRAA